MKLVDANILLYAINKDASHHQAAKNWLDSALGGGATVAFSWVALLSFLRISTNRSVFPQALPVEKATGVVDEWIKQPTAVVVEPTAQHLSVLSELLAPLGTGGNLVNDAHLAALAIEHRCEIVSFDRDFLRFAGVRVETPA